MPVLTRFFGILVMPAGLLWGALITLVIFSFRARQRRIAWALATLTLLYTLAGNVWLGGALIRALENAVPAVHPEDTPTLEAVLVLGGGVKLGPRDFPEAGRAGDRAILAARLYHAGRTPLLVTSGRTVPGLESPRDLSAETLRLWRDLGVPDQAVIRLNSPYNTSMEVDAYRELIARRGWTRVGIVSSAYHLPRVMRSCDRRGLTVIPIAADHRGGRPPINLVNLIPQGSGFYSVHTASWEIVGMLAGR